MKQTILLVDDEEDIREVLEISLMDMGYDVITAENGEKALNLFKEINPPLVLTDIKMPSMDGITLLQRIKHENPEAEVIMITGHGDMDLAIKSLKYEATDFITKPINIDALEIALKRACDKIFMRQKLREYTENLERLIKEKTELQDHLSSLGLMIGSISHGIKGLLTGLDGGMYILDSGFKKEDWSKIDEGYEIVKLTVDRIRKMVLDILYYAKERELSWEKIDVLSFVDEIARTIRPKITSSNIEFETDFDATVGEFEIDPGAFHSALINILSNAMDACTRDDSKDAHKIKFAVKQDEENILFEIWDNGTGMDQETMDNLFTLFFSKKGKKGTGFGLFISDKIVRQHGGKIEVRSKVGEGTGFIVRIPKRV